MTKPIKNVKKEAGKSNKNLLGNVYNIMSVLTTTGLFL